MAGTLRPIARPTRIDVPPMSGAVNLRFRIAFPPNCRLPLLAERAEQDKPPQDAGLSRLPPARNRNPREEHGRDLRATRSRTLTNSPCDPNPPMPERRGQSREAFLGWEPRANMPKCRR